MSFGNRKVWLTPILFMIPIAVVYGVIVMYPLISGIYMGFTNTFILKGTSSFNGIANFVKLFNNRDFLITLRNALIWCGTLVPLTVGLGLLFALYLNAELKGKSVYRSLILIPWVLPAVIAAVIWQYIFEPYSGILNWVLLRLGIIETYVPWLKTKGTVLFSLAVIYMWRAIPFDAVMLLAALQTVSPEIYEAAKMDGAGRFARFRYITIPQILPIVFILAILELSWSFRAFDEPFVLTEGGPANASTLPSLFVYRTAFTYYKMGLGAAAGVVMLAILAIPMIIYVRLRQREAAP